MPGKHFKNWPDHIHQKLKCVQVLQGFEKSLLTKAYSQDSFHVTVLSHAAVCEVGLVSVPAGPKSCCHPHGTGFAGMQNVRLTGS